jgi:glutamine---fructose-6-phosphate transaminase (isomerizing)
MCGIVGYTGPEQAAPILLDGLARLEYRGYDSAGIAVLDGARLTVEKRAGKLGVLRAVVDGALPHGSTGVGHTRWATHGGVTDENAHPHLDCSGEIVVIHNGIIENFAALKQELLANGHRFASETDTEVVPHLIEEYSRAGYALTEAVRRTVGRLDGAAALVVISAREPERIVGARVSNAGAVVVGYGDGQMLLASDVPAILRHTRRVAYLNHGEIASLTPQGVAYSDMDGNSLEKEPVTVAYNEAAAEKGPYRHFMLKEIFEQPEALTHTISEHLTAGGTGLRFDRVRLTAAEIARIRRVVLVGMGTALHAGMMARPFFERLAGLPAECENASEFRYRQPLVGPDTLVIALSQSGETVDTLAAMEEAQGRRALLATVCNNEGGQTTRVAASTILTRCGPEVAVASSKTLTASVVALYLFAAWLGQQRKARNDADVRALIADAQRLPGLVARVLDGAEGAANPYPRLAESYGEARNALVLGRGLQFPVAMEGALKLKEISYIHAEGYPAGEMKHGPIALIDREMPVIMLAPRDGLFEKVVSNIEQIRARRGRVLAIGVEGDAQLVALADDTVLVPAAPELLQPVLTTIPLQLLAYELAVWRGNDVDQPRNLAKTVTVE